MTEEPGNPRGPRRVGPSLSPRLRVAHARWPATYRARSPVWRILVPTVFLLTGALFVTSAVNSDGTDLRAGRYGDLASLVREEKGHADDLRHRANSLTEEVNALAAEVDDAAVEKVQKRIGELRQPAGLLPVVGPGLTVTLDDAPDEVGAGPLAAGEFSADDLVVHQQDIQAVANAMWAGGAEAMSIQGQRVISTTGIKCVGNTVVLHGIPYAPPYVVTAVGDRDSMLVSIESSRYIDIYRQYVAAAGLGWDLELRSKARLPGYDGTLALNYARPAGDAAGDSGNSDL